jgi:hypothetical protein
MITYWAKESIMMGHAFTQKVNGVFDGQFVIEGESNAFNSDWEPGWNYCFGALPSNCCAGCEPITTAK